MSTDEHGTGLVPEDDDIPPSNIDPLNGALLALHAMQEGGLQNVEIISHNDYWKLTSEEQQQKVHLVLQEATYKLWRDRFG